MGTGHLAIEVSIHAPQRKNPSSNYTRYKFKQTNREVFQSTLEAALSSTDFSAVKSNSDIHRHTDFIVTVISFGVIKATPKYKSECSESNPISYEIIAPVKERRRLRRDPAAKTSIDQLHKQIEDDIRIETRANWEQFCNSISLETNQNESWFKILCNSFLTFISEIFSEACLCNNF